MDGILSSQEEQRETSVDLPVQSSTDQPEQSTTSRQAESELTDHGQPGQRTPIAPDESEPGQGNGSDINEEVSDVLHIGHDHLDGHQTAENIQGMTSSSHIGALARQLASALLVQEAETCPQSMQGWRSVYDAVMSKPNEQVIESLVVNCSPEWYRVGLGLHLKDAHINSTTHNIATDEGKLRAIIESKSKEDGSKATVKTLLDVCDQIMPQATLAVIQGLGIDYIDPDSELADEVGTLWKELALDVGIPSKKINDIEKEASTPSEQALQVLKHAKMTNSALSSDEIRARIQKIKQTQYDAQLRNLVFPEDVYDDKRICGREQELDGIFKQFWDGHSREEDIPHYCFQVVTGMGGSGKTSVALKYAAQRKEWYKDGVFLFNAESYASLQTSVRDNMHRLSLAFTKGSLKDENQQFLKHIYVKPKSLLLYDGADKLDLVQSYLPRITSPVHVLVTTRTSENHALLEKANKVTRLGRLTTESAVSAVQAWRGKWNEELEGEEAKYAARLVSQSPLECLPLPIAHAGTYMEKTDISYKEYYQLLKSKQEKLEALVLDMKTLLHYFHISDLKETLSSEGIDHPNDLKRQTWEELESLTMKPKDKQLLQTAWKFVTTTEHIHLAWQLDIEKVKETDKDAYDLLLFASFLSSKNIPERLLCPLAYADVPSHHYRKAVSTLKTHTLIGGSVSSIDIHPLVQSSVFEHLLIQSEDVAHKLATLCQHLLSLLPWSDIDIEASLREDSFMALIPHLYATAEKIGVCPLIQESWSLLYLACRVAIFMKDVDVAVNLCRQNMKLFSVSEYPRQQFCAFYYMGLAYELLLSNPQDAEGHYKSALSVIDTFGVDQLSREYVLVLGRLAPCYSHQRRFKEAEDLHLRVLQQIRERPQDNRLEIATVLNNLAANYMDSGQIEKALRSHEEALEMLEDDPATPPLILSKTLFNMGGCLMENEQSEKALPVVERALSIMRQHLPIHHEDLAQGVVRLSECCCKLGYVQRAMDLANEAWSMALNALPDSHPNMAFYLGQLASCHDKSGRIDEAINCFKQCIEILKKNLPATRHYLCSALNNLGSLYQENGMLEEARKMYEECLSIRRSFLPAQHPDIGRTLYNLGRIYEDSNDIPRATELFKECLYIYENSLSRTHPHFTKVLLALGEIGFKLERYGEALQFNERLHDILMETAPRSDLMAAVCSIMGICYMTLGQLNSAEEWLSKSLEIQRTILPQGHDSISLNENMLHIVWQMKFIH